MAIKSGDRLTVVVDILEARDQGNVAFRVGGKTCLASAKDLEAALALYKPEIVPESARSGKSEAEGPRPVFARLSGRPLVPDVAPEAFAGLGGESGGAGASGSFDELQQASPEPVAVPVPEPEPEPVSQPPADPDAPQAA